MEEKDVFVNSTEPEIRIVAGADSEEETVEAAAGTAAGGPCDAETTGNPAEEPENAPDTPTAGDAETAETTEPLADPATVIAALAAERDALKDQLLRLRADFDNFRKRVLRDAESLRATAARETIRSLLPVRDNLERALTHDPADGPAFAEGVRMILRQFDEALAAQGLEAIEADGQDFDPNVHEALTYAPSDTIPAGRVSAVYERGYRIGGMLLRPARVVVSSGPPGGDTPSPDGNSPGDNGCETENGPEPASTPEPASEPGEN